MAVPLYPKPSGPGKLVADASVGQTRAAATTANLRIPKLSWLLLLTFGNLPRASPSCCSLRDTTPADCFRASDAKFLTLKNDLRSMLGDRWKALYPAGHCASLRRYII